MVTGPNYVATDEGAHWLRVADEILQMADTFAAGFPRRYEVIDAGVGSLEFEVVAVATQLSADLAQTAFRELIDFWSGKVGEAAANLAAFLALIELFRHRTVPPSAAHAAGDEIERPQRGGTRLPPSRFAHDELPEVLAAQLLADEALRLRFERFMSGPTAVYVGNRLFDLPMLEFLARGVRLNGPVRRTWLSLNRTCEINLSGQVVRAVVPIEQLRRPRRGAGIVALAGVANQLWELQCADAALVAFAATPEGEHVLRSALLECDLMFSKGLRPSEIVRAYSYCPAGEDEFLPIPRLVPETEPT